MRYILVLLFLVQVAVLTQAQSGPCTESAVNKGDMPTSDDAFAYMPPYGSPVIGKPAIHNANEKSFSDRTNIESSWVGDHRVVSTASADMSYEYGTLKMSYDSKSEGHQTFEAVMLIVYKAKEGVCQKVALTMQPLEDEAKH